MSSILPIEAASATTTGRRVHGREKIRSLAYVDLGSTSGGVLLDLSEDGLALAAATKLVDHNVLSMCFELPMLHQRIEARGRVVWLSESKKVAGIKFEDLADDAVQKIRKWISTQRCANEESRGYLPQDRKTLEPISVADPAQPHELASSNTGVAQPVEAPIEITMFTGDHERSVQHPGEVSTGPSGKESNRRVNPRQSVSPLTVYVDLGPANGGIVLNLSEGGLALTAAAKLTEDQLPRWRFELPNLPGWIEGHGRIVWLSESKKEAGVKFEALPDGALTKIKNWISTQRANEERREGAAPEVELIAASRAEALHREPVARPVFARDKNVENIGVLHSLGESSAGPVPISLAPNEEQESILEQSRHGKGSQRSEPRWSQFAAVMALIAIISLGTGILIERHFSQGSVRNAESKLAQVVQQMHDMYARSSLLAPEKASSANTQAYNQAKIGSGVGSSGRSTSSSASNLPPAGVVYKGTDPAPNVVVTTNLGRKQGALAYERTDASAARKPPIFETSKSTPATFHSVTLARPTAALESTSPVRQAVPPQINITMPPGSPGFVLAASVVNANETMHVSPSTDVMADAASASPSVTITMPPFPSIRVPTGLKSHSFRPETSLQIDQSGSRAELAYPPEAVRQRIEGTVKLHAIIGRDGAVKSVVAIGPSLLGEAASRAVRKWRYKPTVLAGQAIEAEQDIIIVFRLPVRATASN